MAYEGIQMKLREFIEKHKLPDTMQLGALPLKHPETKEKIYVQSSWCAGFWYRKIPNAGDGRIYPCQYRNDLNELEIYGRARNEIKELLRVAAGV